MGCNIFIRTTRKLFFHNKIKKSNINVTRLHTSSGRSNRSTNKIIIISIGKVTQFCIFLRHRDEASKLANKQIKIFLCFVKKIRSGGDENERQMQIKGK